MKKNYLIGAGVLVVVIIAAIFMFGGGNGSKGGGSLFGLSEKEKFAQYSVEAMCIAFEYSDASDAIEDDPEKSMDLVTDLTNTITALNEKYGYDLDEVNDLMAEYTKDSDFADLIVEGIQDSCPHPGEEVQIGYTSRIL